MAEQIYTNALTTVARVKNRLSITGSTWDSVLLRLVNSATDFIETQCNRKFGSATYTEYQSIDVDGAKYVFLDQAPVSAITSFQYREGLYNSPNYTDIPATDYELMGSGESGIIRVHGYFFRGTDTVKIVYTAGYAIDFDNFGTTSHTLPADITELCEKIVVRWFKKREAEGKSEEIMGTEAGGTIKWQNGLNKDDQAIINAHKRMPRFV